MFFLANISIKVIEKIYNICKLRAYLKNLNYY